MLISLVLFLIGNLPAAGRKFCVLILPYLLYPFIGNQRRKIIANLQVAFPEKSPKELKAIAAKNIRYMLEMGFDVIHWIRHPQDMEACIAPAQIPPELGDRNTGELWMTAHMGNWEAMGRIKKYTGKAGGIVTSEFDYKPLDRAIKRFRSYHGTEVIVDSGASVACTRNLKQNRSVGILIDQNISPKNGGEFVNFFGLPAPTSKLPASLARKLNIPIVISCCVKNAEGKWITITKLLPKPPVEYQDDLELTQAIFKEYENLIRQYPEQYIWAYSKWRYIPNNIPVDLKPKFPYYAKLYREYTCNPSLFES